VAHDGPKFFAPGQAVHRLPEQQREDFLCGQAPGGLPAPRFQKDDSSALAGCRTGSSRGTRFGSDCG